MSSTTPPILSCGHIDVIEIPPKREGGKVKTVQRWRMWADNDEMIADAFALFVDLQTDRVLDPTYGNGNFYKIAKPRKLVARDLRKDGFDARKMATPKLDENGRPKLDENGQVVFNRPAYKPESFQAVVLDFPYVSKGGRDTSTIDDMDEAYGMYDAPGSPTEVQALINEGMCASVPLIEIGGHLFVKTMNYVSSGKVFDSVYNTKSMALNSIVGLVLVGEFIFSSGLPGPQPLTNLNGTQRTQVHGRSNWSTLLVFEKREPKKIRARQGQPISLAMARNILDDTTMAPDVMVAGPKKRAPKVAVGGLGEKAPRRVAPKPAPVEPRRIIRRGV